MTIVPLSGDLGCSHPRWERPSAAGTFTHAEHQKPQPTVTCFLCNNQIKCLWRHPGSASAAVVGGEMVQGAGKEGGGGAGRCHQGLGVTQGFPAHRAGTKELLPCILPAWGLGIGQPPATMQKISVDWLFSFLPFISVAPHGLVRPGLTQALWHSPELQHRGRQAGERDCQQPPREKSPLGEKWLVVARRDNDFESGDGAPALSPWLWDRTWSREELGRGHRPQGSPPPKRRALAQDTALLPPPARDVAKSPPRRGVCAELAASVGRTGWGCSAGSGTGLFLAISVFSYFSF